jgi:serine/threonine protein kinase
MQSETYEPLDKIGSGSFGVIRKIKRVSDGKILARKEIDYHKMSEKEKKQLVTEVNNLRKLRHPHIVRYYERIVDREQSLIHIVMEYCPGGDLGTVIKKCKEEGYVSRSFISVESMLKKEKKTELGSRWLSEKVIWSLFTQLLLALHECHHGSSHATILHRDLKPENVFLDGQQNAKLGDFGLSRVLEDPKMDFAKTYVG